MLNSSSALVMTRCADKNTAPVLPSSDALPQTDEDMFRALLLFPPSSTGKVTMEPPLSITLIDNTKEYGDEELAVSPDGVFTTAVGHSSKRTLASWHVTTPEEVVEHMLYLVGEVPQGEELKGYL
jgi:trehalose 6-phosphate synthase/phosphatase